MSALAGRFNPLMLAGATSQKVQRRTWVKAQEQTVKCIAADRKEPTGQSILAIRPNAGTRLPSSAPTSPVEGDNKVTKYDNDGPNLEEEQMLEAEARRRGISVTQLRMLLAVPDSLVKDLVSDNSQRAPQAKPVSSVRGTGWQPERKLEQPPGILIMDRMMDAQDAVDRRALAKRLGG